MTAISTPRTAAASARQTPSERGVWSWLTTVDHKRIGTTIVNLRAPGMNLMRMPQFTWNGIIVCGALWWVSALYGWLTTPLEDAH